MGKSLQSLTIFPTNLDLILEILINWSKVKKIPQAGVLSTRHTQMLITSFVSLQELELDPKFRIV